MRVRDLGAMAVGPEGAVIRGGVAPAILARLAVEVNRRVSVESLMHAAWGDRVSPGAASTLESHVWRLRRLLEPGRPPRQASTVLVNDAGGYRLVGTLRTVDSLAFEQLAGDVRDLTAAGDPHSALERADEALRLWRGRPYGRYADEEFARATVARLEELRAQLREHRLAALLGVGENERALVDVGAAITEHPFRERLRALQMLGLYRAGRADEASEAFREARAWLVDQLGCEPGLELRELHRRILGEDPDLLLPPEAPRRTAGPVAVHLPPTLTRLVGRDEEGRRLADLVLRNRLVTVTGAAGCGKTRIAVEVARGLAPSFPDGVWFVDLTSLADPSLVADLVVSTIGLASSPARGAAEELREYVHDRRLLVVLDNCEHVLPAVSRLVETALRADDTVESPCRLVLTSREPLGTPGEVAFGLHPLPLPSDTQPDSPAVELFTERLRAAAPALELTPEVRRLAVEICVSLDGLPLGLELAAARARSFTLVDIADQARADPGGLRLVGRHSADDHKRALRSTIEWSHALLEPDEQRAHRRLAVLPGPFTPLSAAAVMGEDASTATELLARLAHRSMLVSNGPEEAGRTTLMRQLAPIRSHAHECLERSEELGEVTDRRDQWVTDLVGRRPRLGAPGEAVWFDALDDAQATVRTTLSSRLVETPTTAAVLLPASLAFYWYYRAQMVEALRWLRTAHDLAVVAGSDDVLPTRLALGGALVFQGRDDLARPLLDRALPLVADERGGRRTEIGELLVGIATSAFVRDQVDLLRLVHTTLVPLVDAAQDEELGLLADGVGALARMCAGDLEAAAETGRAVYERAVARDNSMAVGIATAPLMVEALYAGRPADGIPWVNRIMRAHLRVGSRAGGMFIENRANFAAQAGELLDAARLYAAARVQTRRAAMRWPRRPLTTTLLEATRDRLTGADFQRAWQEGEGLSLLDVVQLDESPPTDP